MSTKHTAAFRRALIAVLCVYWICLFVGTHTPAGPPMPAVSHFDKLAHFIGYAGLTLLLSAALAAAAGTFDRRPAVHAFFIAAAYGALDEMLQIPIAGRHAELRDWLADLAGAATGATVFVACRSVAFRMRRRRAVAGTLDAKEVDR